MGFSLVLPLVMLAIVGVVLAAVFLMPKSRSRSPVGRARWAESTQEFIGILGFPDDMIQVSEERFRAVIEVEPINVALLDEVDADALLTRWRDFLMSLRFPIQIYVGSQRLDPDEVVAALQSRLHYLTGPRREYAEALMSQLHQYVSQDAMLVRRIYIVLIWDSHRQSFRGSAHEAAKRDLDVWCKTTIASLRAMKDIRARRLRSDELAQLVHAAWLRDRSRFLNLRRIAEHQPFALTVTGTLHSSEGGEAAHVRATTQTA